MRERLARFMLKYPYLWIRLIVIFVGFGGVAALVACAHQQLSGSDITWVHSDERETREYPLYDGVVYSSHYLTMRDGVKIAVDLYLPKGLQEGEKLPTILHQTRYLRSIELRRPFRWLLRGKPFDPSGLYYKNRALFVAHGYAWVDVDVRGSGASFGTHPYPFSAGEILDGAEIVDWIIQRPWSNGRVGATGISYDGTAVEFLLVNQHPAVKAIAPRFTLFDAYADIAFPGGIHLNWFTEHWGRMNDALDRNAPHEVAGGWIKLFVTGVQPVETDPNRSMLKSAVEAHAENFDVHADALLLTYRDDITDSQRERSYQQLIPGRAKGAIDVFSPHTYIQEIEASGAAIYNYTGWFDGESVHAAIKRYLTLKNQGSRLTIGPWNHSGTRNSDPFSKTHKVEFDHDQELLRFFDCYLKGIDNGLMAEKPIHYFTMGEERWKSADIWPPPESKRAIYYFAGENKLVQRKPEVNEEYDAYPVDFTAGTGEQSRWRTTVNYRVPVQYLDRNEQDAKLLTYTSEPLEKDVEVTGHPIVTLYISSTADDGNFFVYLEDVDKSGHVTYVTEGMLRAIHRKVSGEEPPYRTPTPYHTFKRQDAMALIPGQIAELQFDLLPTSYLFKKGHSIRVALAGADKDHFAVPEGEPPTVRFYRTELYPSHIDLPVVAR